MITEQRLGSSGYCWRIRNEVIYEKTFWEATQGKRSQAGTAGASVDQLIHDSNLKKKTAPYCIGTYEVLGNHGCPIKVNSDKDYDKIIDLVTSQVFKT